MVALNIGAGIMIHQSNITMQDKKPRNEKGQEHGYWEIYYLDEPWFNCYYINGVEYGCCECWNWNKNSSIKFYFAR